MAGDDGGVVALCCLFVMSDEAEDCSSSSSTKANSPTDVRDILAVKGKAAVAPINCPRAVGGNGCTIR